MQSYTLYDMLTMVRLGCWNGGFVEKIGYVGDTVEGNRHNTICGVMGLYISPTVMIESITVLENGRHQFCVSYYDPYKDVFVIYMLPISSIKADLSILTLIDLIDEDEVLRRKISRSNYHYRERRYKAEYSSLRSGSMGTPRESKMFKRR